MKIVTTFFLLGIAAILLATSKTYTNLITFRFYQDDFLNTIAKHQIFAIIVAIIVVFAIIKLNVDSKAFLKIGQLNILADRENWLGINGNTSWKKNGLQLLLFVSIPTSIFMFSAVKYTNNLSNFQWSFIP